MLPLACSQRLAVTASERTLYMVVFGFTMMIFAWLLVPETKGKEVDAFPKRIGDSLTYRLLIGANG